MRTSNTETSAVTASIHLGSPRPQRFGQSTSTRGIVRTTRPSHTSMTGVVSSASNDQAMK